MKKLFFIYAGLAFITVNLFLCSCNIKNSNNGTAAKVNTDSTVIHLKGGKKTILPSYKVVEKFDELQMFCNASMQTYKYDGKGNMIEYMCYSVDADLLKKDSIKYTPINRGVLRYDDKGNRIEEDYYNEDGSINGKNIYKYDDKSNLIEQEHCKSDGSLTDKIIYKYDGNGNYIAKNTSSINSIASKTGETIEHRHTYKYNSKGNIIEENDIAAGYDEKYTYKYDDKENVIEMDSYGAGELGVKIIYKYDSNDNLIEQNRYIEEGAAELLTDKDIYKNDDIGNCIKHDEYDANGKLKETSIYKYDPNGNIIEQIGDSHFANHFSPTINPLYKFYQCLLPWIQ